MSTNIVAVADRAGIFSAVRHGRFRRLWTASILSGVAYMTALTARGWVAFDLLNAVSFLQANMNGARLLGPLLAAPLLHVGGGAGAFLIAAALSALALWQIGLLGEVPHQRSGSDHNPLVQLAQGVRYVIHAPVAASLIATGRSEEHTSELQSRGQIVCRLLLEKKTTPAYG